MILLTASYIAALNLPEIRSLATDAQSHEQSNLPACVYSAGGFCVRDLGFVIETRRASRRSLAAFSMHELSFPNEAVTVIYQRTCRSVRSDHVTLINTSRRFLYNRTNNLMLKFRIGINVTCDVMLITPLLHKSTLMGMSIAVGQIYACNTISCSRSNFASAIPNRLRIFGAPP